MNGSPPVKPDLARAQLQPRDFLEVGRDLCRRHVNEAVIARILILM